MLVPVVMAGGTGSRLWPVSRAMLPKQFIDLPNQQGSLFQNTLSRLEGLADVSEALVVCNADHRFLVAEQLRQLQNFHSTILLEPVGRSTAPAVALAALRAQQDHADPILLVLTADHLIKDRKAFHQAITVGTQLAQQDKLVTFGIVPGAPETAYGYIETGEQLGELPAFAVSRFVEKPDLETAKTYLATGKYHWNSGMFMFTAARYLQELKHYAPDIFDCCHRAYAALESGEDFCHIPEAIFAECRSESIDYAVMEKTTDAAVVPLDAGWNDLGAWDAMWDVQEKDDKGNAIHGDVLTVEVSNSYVQSQSRLVAAVGVEDLVIVETADAVLVAAKNKVQAVKQIVEQLTAKGRSESISHTLVHRPWGHYQLLATGDGYQIKHLVVKPGASISLQLHHHRSEHWTVIRGAGLIVCNDREFMMHPNESTFIPVGSKHRLSNPGDEAVEIIEIQVGTYLGEDDIERFEDDYGRVGSENLESSS